MAASHIEREEFDRAAQSLRAAAMAVYDEENRSVNNDE